MLPPVDLAHTDTHDLWRMHHGLHGRHHAASAHARGPSLLDLKIELARRILRSCSLCERRCGVDRTAGSRGFCGTDDQSRVFFEQILLGEEKPLIPSHEVFFSGCNMRCSFCYSWEAILDPGRGHPMSPTEFASLVDSRRREGAVNLNLIGGEPTVNLPAILSALRLVTEPTPIVWNSNSYMSEETMRLLDGVVDLFVGDFRFGNNRCAADIAMTEGYFETASRNFVMAAESADLIIRHLLLPGHVECCLRPIAEWVATNLPEVPFNLMFQYVPCFQAAGDPNLGRVLSDNEKSEALEIVSSLRLNTRRWNTRLRGTSRMHGIGRGRLETTITILPDGQVSIMHLHEQLLDFAQALKGEDIHGG